MFLKRRMVLFLRLGGMCLGVVSMAAGQEGQQGETEAPAQKAAPLEREAAELNDVIGMLFNKSL